MEVNQSRLRSDIETNGEFGAIDGVEGHGRTVFTGTDADRKARDYLTRRLEDAGLSVRVDAVGNVVGRWAPDSVDEEAAAVASGSHLDSVPRGGIFDGPLGVYAALEAVRSMQEAGIEPVRPIDVVAFTEEEGQRFSAPLLGSKVAAGSLPVEDAYAVEDDDGVTVRTALEEIGYRGDEPLDASEWDSWLELHVEQSTELEERDVPVGVVTTITGITHAEVRIEGEANHAGATAMPGRRDALAAAAEFVLDVERAANEVVAADSPTAVGTVGKANVVPNGTNVVPGAVTMGLDVRDVERESIDYLVDRARKSLARVERDREVTTELDQYFDLDPVPMAERCREAAHATTGIQTVDLHSGAGHDTMEIARVTDAGLLFAPSRDGLSHTPLEWTDWADCAAATRVLTGALAELAT